MTRKSIVIFLFAMMGCKGETVVKDNPDTVNALDSCKKTLDEKNKLVQALQDENASLMRGGANPNEVVIAIEGNLFTVRPGKPGSTPPIDEKVAAAASKEFYNLVEKSRGAIQKCYEQALKKNTGLQAKTVTLSVNASFNPQGAYQNSSFSPSLGDTFDNCMKGIASKWSLPANATTMTFKASVSLTPS
jgi:hypothetical protein